ncbi:MAG: Asp23/Gls24 family envelope stress response protein [Clostridiales bacterium]|jgi:uncharacterized alkaline shock family protein YloU|nr:Asp23/Gls24 family envelope stress response protein [Clostridiales bacterium]MBQ3019406.1 Asp23/Gls24 family envelope stress response protein [Clostridia bacterium]
MSVNTNNAYGKISITDLAIAKVASKTAMGAYGIVEMAARLPRDRYKKDECAKGIRVTTFNNRIYIDVYVVMKYGVSISAVAESLKEEVKYKVEAFTDMVVSTVNVNVVGIKL